MHCLERSLDRTLRRFARTGSVVSACFTSFPRSHLIGVRRMPQSRHSLSVVPAAPFRVRVMRSLAKSLLFLILLLTVPALSRADPPTRVGRVSLVSGTFAFYGPGDTDWSAAKINLPVAAGAWLM